MTVPPQGAPHHELRRRIAGCRERLRKARSAQRQPDQGAPTAPQTAGDEPLAADEEEGGRLGRDADEPPPSRS
ncbi:MAG TPA: hypothetical protein VM864_09865 [Pyrinomonadaceae bacterium]|jgi:hypothetical protein|nr:hypothetical protein [Pyrinomonadaceae bacterium]